jgi:nucleotide-binding universal stress UspA family protein
MEKLERPPMSGALIVGYDGSDQANDALALGRLLAGPLEAELVVACVYPPAIHFPYTGIEVVERKLREPAERQLAAAPGVGELRRELFSAASPARGLVAFAEQEGARFLVVGASHRGAVGEGLLGTVARSVLHGAPCSVAIPPRGFARRPLRQRRLIGVGFDGSPESELALDEAIALADAFGAELRLVAVVHSGELFPAPAWVGFGNARFADAVHERHRRQLDRGLARVPERLRATGLVTVGDSARALESEAERGLDLLVVGSRGYGALRRVLLGSVASELLHAAPVRWSSAPAAHITKPRTPAPSRRQPGARGLRRPRRRVCVAMRPGRRA